MSRGSLMRRRTWMTNGAARLDELHEQVTDARKMCGGYFVSTMHRRHLVFTHQGLAMLNGITASQSDKGVSEVAGYDHLCSRNGRMAKMSLRLYPGSHCGWTAQCILLTSTPALPLKHQKNCYR